MGRHVLVVYTNPVEGEEDEYNKWYDETHLPDIVDVPGVVSGSRLKLNPVAGTGEGATHQYLASMRSTAIPPPSWPRSASVSAAARWCCRAPPTWPGRT